jgi:hypothetical protein
MHYLILWDSAGLPFDDRRKAYKKLKKTLERLSGRVERLNKNVLIANGRINAQKILRTLKKLKLGTRVFNVVEERGNPFPLLRIFKKNSGQKNRRVGQKTVNINPTESIGKSEMSESSILVEKKEKPKPEKKEAKVQVSVKKPSKAKKTPVKGAPLINRVRKVKEDVEVVRALLDVVEKNPAVYPALKMFWNNGLSKSIAELEKLASGKK